MGDSVREMMRAKQREKERKASELAAALKSSKNKEQVRASAGFKRCLRLRAVRALLSVD